MKKTEKGEKYEPQGHELYGSATVETRWQKLRGNNSIEDGGTGIKPSLGK